MRWQPLQRVQSLSTILHLSHVSKHPQVRYTNLGFISYQSSFFCELFVVVVTLFLSLASSFYHHSCPLQSSLHEFIATYCPFLNSLFLFCCRSKSCCYCSFHHHHSSPLLPCRYPSSGYVSAGEAECDSEGLFLCCKKHLLLQNSYRGALQFREPNV
jgi:hypothetical protein